MKNKNRNQKVEKDITEFREHGKGEEIKSERQEKRIMQVRRSLGIEEEMDKE